jgi:hypothetical protein
MRGIFMSIVLVSVLGAPAVGWADTTTPPVPDVTTSATPGPSDDDIVCKSEAVTGTRFPTRICQTRRQWKELETSSSDYLSKSQTSAGGKTPGGR